MADLKLTQTDFDDDGRAADGVSFDYPTLTADDGAALDALLASRRLNLPDEPDTASPLQSLTALLDLASRHAPTPAPAPGSGFAPGYETVALGHMDEAVDVESLIAATLAGVQAARDAAAVPDTLAEDLALSRFTLHPDDAAAVDALLDPAPGHPATPKVAPARLEQARSVLALLDVLRQDDRRIDGADELLVQQTLDRAAEERQRQRFAQQVALFAEPKRGIGVGWRQVLTAAAVFFLGFSLLMPALDHNRQQARQMACATNLAIAGQQMGAYAADFGGMLPRGPVGSSWIKTGQPDAVDAQGRYQSNSAHLYLLIKESYLAPQRLACAGNAFASDGPVAMHQLDWRSPRAISYSYQNQYSPIAIRVDRAMPTLAVLADKNPLFVVRSGRVEFDRRAERDAASLLHDRAGQNILTLDGRVYWTAKPRVGDDNVWQIAGHAGPYLGTEAPADPHRDSFLVP